MSAKNHVIHLAKKMASDVSTEDLYKCYEILYNASESVEKVNKRLVGPLFYIVLFMLNVYQLSDYTVSCSSFFPFPGNLRAT